MRVLKFKKGLKLTRIQAGTLLQIHPEPWWPESEEKPRWTGLIIVWTIGLLFVGLLAAYGMRWWIDG